LSHSSPAPASGSPGHARIGIDVGGTFTDFVLFAPGRGSLVHHKQPSTPDDPSLAVAEGLRALLQKADLGADRIGLLIHGTTIGLNAVIQRRVARVALVVTRGFRDVLEIGRSRMPSSFDFHASKESPLVPRDHVVEIAARLNRHGEPTQSPDDAELAEAASALRALAPDAVALMLINGYANPRFEGALAERLSTALEGVPVSSASVIWPEIREFERTLVACMNAGIQPLMQGYFDRLQDRLARDGVTAPIFVTGSNGGSLSVATARLRPVETLLSGPASGVMAASRLAGEAGLARIISFDMGGTSSDIAVSTDGEPEFATRTEIGGLPLVLPVVAVSAIGAGGGSVLRVDAQGMLKVGPQSAGADPGPVAYGRGGTRATVTDCYLVTGLIDPDRFLGGRLRLDHVAAERALAEIAAQLGLTGPDAAAQAAWGALRVATSGMVTELFKTMASRGLNPAEFALLPFGGAGPTHANLLAEEAEILRILVPGPAATFCALGAVAADLRRDFVRSLRRRLNPSSAAELAALFSSLNDEARLWLAGEGDLARSVEFQYAVDMRYSGQAYELRVGLPHGAAGPADIAEAFHAAHERLYGFRDLQAPVELSTARLAIIGRVAPVALPRLARAIGSPVPGGRRRVFLGDGWIDAAVFDRAGLGAGHRIMGPAIIEQDDTTTPVLPGWAAHVDDHGNLDLAPGAA
jgi:N-methylhydantoinase A